MSEPTDAFSGRYPRFLAALAEAEGIGAEAIHEHFAAYADSVVAFFVASLERYERDGFADAFRLVDLLEGLGCRDLAVADPERPSPVVVLGVRADGRAFRLELVREGLNRDRVHLVRHLKAELGLALDTATAARVRPRSAPPPVLPPDGRPDLLAAPRPGADVRRRITHTALARLVGRVKATPRTSAFARPWREAEGPRGRQLAERLGRALEALGCRDARIVEVQAHGAIRVAGTAPVAAPFDAPVPRSLVETADPAEFRRALGQIVLIGTGRDATLPLGADAVPRLREADARTLMTALARLQCALPAVAPATGAQVALSLTSPDGDRLTLTIPIERLAGQDAGAIATVVLPLLSHTVEPA